MVPERYKACGLTRFGSHRPQKRQKTAREGAAIVRKLEGSSSRVFRSVVSKVGLLARWASRCSGPVGCLGWVAFLPTCRFQRQPVREVNRNSCAQSGTPSHLLTLCRFRSAAASELVAKGYDLVHETRTEPWGQVIARLLGPEGLLVGVCYCPWMHEG